MDETHGESVTELVLDEQALPVADGKLVGEVLSLTETLMQLEGVAVKQALMLTVPHPLAVELTEPVVQPEEDPDKEVDVVPVWQGEGEAERDPVTEVVRLTVGHEDEDIVPL